jgi:aspartate ammonia-lyase
MAYSVLMSITIMSNMLGQFTDFCIKGITVNQHRTDYYVQSTVSLATALNPYIGYAKAAEIAKESVKTGKSIIDIARSRGDLTEEQIKEILDPARMTEPVSPLEVAKEREKIKSRG